MTKDASELLSEANQYNTRHREHLRDVADWFHTHEGEMFEREDARDQIADDLSIDEDVAFDAIRNLVGDTVDPVVQVPIRGEKYVGVIEFEEFDGAYGYLDYDDVFGKRRRVVCAQCVHDADYDKEVTHATAGDSLNHGDVDLAAAPREYPSSFGPDASYSDLLDGVHLHYKYAHDVMPKTVETGASLVSGTTIGGNTAWHAGNDGSGSGLDADSVDGTEGSNLGVTDHANLSNVTSDQHHSPPTITTNTLPIGSRESGFNWPSVSFDETNDVGYSYGWYIGSPLDEVQLGTGSAAAGESNFRVRYADGATRSIGPISSGNYNWYSLDSSKVVAVVTTDYSTYGHLSGVSVADTEHDHAI